MSNQGCILGCLTIDSTNNQIDWTEDPGGGSEATLQTSITAGDYFLDSTTGSEDLIATVNAAMDAKSALSGNTWEYSISYSASTGLLTITANNGDFQLLTDTGYEDSVFLLMGWDADDPTSSSNSLTADDPADGTIFWATPDSAEELMADSYWKPRKHGGSAEGCTGRRYSRIYAFSDYRTLKVGPIVGYSYGYTYADVDWVRTCYENHWGYGKRVRIYTNTRTLETATNDQNIFDAVILNDVEPARYEGREELDLFEYILEVQKYVS